MSELIHKVQKKKFASAKDIMQYGQENNLVNKITYFSQPLIKEIVDLNKMNISPDEESVLNDFRQTLYGPFPNDPPTTTKSRKRNNKHQLEQTEQKVQKIGRQVVLKLINHEGVHDPDNIPFTHDKVASILRKQFLN